MVDTPDLDPITFLDFERSDPYSGEITAPYRLDCALTYRVADAEAGEAAPLDRVDRELSSDEWKVILDKAWDAGIPHIIFTGGEPTLRSDLADLITHAEQLGQVTGVLTNGLRLAEKDYLQQLLQSGLDHLMVIFDTNEEQAWEALRDVMAEDIFATVHLTITKIDTEEIVGALQRMKELGVESLSLSAMDADLNSTLQEIREAAADMQFSLVWDVPVPYSSFNPVSLEMSGEGEKVRGAGKAWLYVEPDGDVLEAQGKPKVSGNLLTNTWSEIWDKVLSDMQKHEA